MDDKNDIQKAIDQIGEISVMRYLPKGMRIHNCEIHGRYLGHYKTKEPMCPLCVHVDSGEGNGTTATEVEHYIDLKDAINELMPPCAAEVRLEELNGHHTGYQI